LGDNLRMTEIQAAILLAQLGRLPEQTMRREANARYLDQQLQEVPGVAITKRDARVTQRSYHLYIFRFLKGEWPGVSRAQFLAALNAEGIPAHSGYPAPLYKNPLFARQGQGPRYCPLSCPYYGEKLDYQAVVCPNVERLCQEACWLRHSLLLAERSDIQHIADAIVKLWDNRADLADG
jgi:dTDP-4-amino-4,6-dideoxygalactose transaminase